MSHNQPQESSRNLFHFPVWLADGTHQNVEVDADLIEQLLEPDLDLLNLHLALNENKESGDVEDLAALPEIRRTERRVLLERLLMSERRSELAQSSEDRSGNDFLVEGAISRLLLRFF